MKKRKRIGFTIGMMLLMGGWGLTWYVHEQQQIFGVSDTSLRRTELWMEGRPIRYTSDGGKVILLDTIPSRITYAAGIALMMIGAGVTAFNLPLPDSWK